MSAKEIGKTIHKLGQLTKQLEKQKNLIGGIKDTTRTRNEIRVRREEGRKLVSTLEVEVNEDNLLSHEYSKLLGAFETSSENFSQVDQSIESKLAGAGPPKKSSMPESELSPPNDDNWGAGENKQQKQEQQSQFREFDENIDHDNKLRKVKKNKEDVDGVVQELTDLNQLQRDFNEITHSQQEEIDVIEENVVEAKDNIEIGAVDIEQASTYQNSARKKQCCIAMFFIIVLVVLLVMIFGTDLFKKK